MPRGLPGLFLKLSESVLQKFDFCGLKVDFGLEKVVKEVHLIELGKDLKFFEQVDFNHLNLVEFTVNRVMSGIISIFMLTQP